MCRKTAREIKQNKAFDNIKPCDRDDAIKFSKNPIG